MRAGADRGGRYSGLTEPRETVPKRFFALCMTTCLEIDAAPSGSYSGGPRQRNDYGPANNRLTEGGLMSDVETHSEPDGSLVIQPHGVMDADRAVPLRQLLVHAVRKVRPRQLIVDLRDVHTLDAINLGTLAALCGVADDHRVALVLANPSAEIRSELLAAGVAAQRIRYTRETTSVDTPEVASMS
ncbi:MAG TPA: STAS domain-containing protein [Actinoplanes sp.]